VRFFQPQNSELLQPKSPFRRNLNVSILDQSPELIEMMNVISSLSLKLDDLMSSLVTKSILEEHE
jgi:hypothetical protein